MKINKDVKRAIRENERYYVDYDPETKHFVILNLSLNGKTVGDVIKEGFNDKKNIISKKDDELKMIYHKEEEADAVATAFNDKLEDGTIIVSVCSDCGRYFYINEEEIKWYNENNFNFPKRDKLCRIKRKAATSENKDKKSSGVKKSVKKKGK